MTDEEIWDTWARLKNRPRARAFLRVLATQHFDSLFAAYRLFRVTPHTKAEWRKVPGFTSLEHLLFSNPAGAAKFIAVMNWAAAVAYQADILNDKVSGNKAAASRYIIHTADPAMRKPIPPETPPGSPPPIEKKRLEDMLKAAELDRPLSTREILESKYGKSEYAKAMEEDEAMEATGQG